MEVTINTNALSSVKTYYNGNANQSALNETKTASENNIKRTDLSEEISNLEKLQNIIFTLLGMESPGADTGKENGVGKKINLVA